MSSSRNTETYKSNRQTGATVIEHLLLMAAVTLIATTSLRFLDNHSRSSFTTLSRQLALDGGGTFTTTRGGFDGPGDSTDPGDDDPPAGGGKGR